MKKKDVCVATFEIFTTVRIRIEVFRIVMPCSFGGPWYACRKSVTIDCSGPDLTQFCRLHQYMDSVV